MMKKLKNNWEKIILNSVFTIQVNSDHTFFNNKVASKITKDGSEKLREMQEKMKHFSNNIV